MPRCSGAGDNTLIPSPVLMDRGMLSALPEVRPIHTQNASIALLLAGKKRKKMAFVSVYLLCKGLAVTLHGC